MASADKLYSAPRPVVHDFTFGSETAAVFDDMLDRSVPLYQEIQRMIGEIVTDFAVDGTSIYDLGCSTCRTFRELQHLEKDVLFVGVDDSAAMLARAEQELQQAGFTRRHELRHQDLHQGLVIENASAVIMSLTLQFIRPLFRERLIQTVFEGLHKQGCLILIEKVLSPDTLINRLFIKYYHEFKRRNGYSEIEIAQKREALENVLIPYRLRENEQLLRHAGFSSVDIFIKWYNFYGVLAVK